MTKQSYLKNAQIHFLDGIGVPERKAFVVDDFQQEAISHVVDGVDTLVVAPTGSGKTYIALEAINATLSQKKRAVYTTPLKALSNTKYNELRHRFEPQHSVGLLTGDRKIEVHADVVIATTEIYRNELYESSDRYSLVILDEVHFIADAQRGPVWEEAILLTPRSSTLLMLSASISNSTEIADWIEGVREKPCKVIIKKERPVELRYGFLHPEFGPLPLADERGGVFKEVLEFYGSTGLDSSGRRLRERGFRGRSNYRRRRRDR